MTVWGEKDLYIKGDLGTESQSGPAHPSRFFQGSGSAITRRHSTHDRTAARLNG
jgi:hypothetical protein